MKQNIIPKSLHTVTVLVAVARLLMDMQPMKPISHCVAEALAVLGYADTPDTYELAAKARAILNKSVQS